eukprot:58803-Chlamydomonas_euryale.AAC.5
MVQVSPSYAPPGQTLVSVSTVGTCDEMDDGALAAAVKVGPTALVSIIFGPSLYQNNHLRPVLVSKCPYGSPCGCWDWRTCYRSCMCVLGRVGRLGCKFAPAVEVLWDALLAAARAS